MNRKKKGAEGPAKFKVGDRVRVKPGTTVPDFEDMPLGGWAGAITEVDQRSKPPTDLIEWNKHTLDHMHPVYRKRCERDGLEMESMWLGEDDFEADTGSPVVIDQPTSIVTRPLNEKDEDDRVRKALGLTSDDPLSEVDEETLGQYHSYLVGRLSFPFQATFSTETGPLQDTSHAVTVLSLLDTDDCDEMYGLMCQARQGRRQVVVPLGELAVTKSDPNRQLVEDYSSWFWNNR